MGPRLHFALLGLAEVIVAWGLLVDALPARHVCRCQGQLGCCCCCCCCRHEHVSHHHPASPPSHLSRPQYKFIVDGQWRHDPNLPSMYDDMGNINNVMEVQVSGPAGWQRWW